MTFPLVFNILREKCDEGVQYKRRPLSIERRITGCKFFPSAFWNIPTGAVFLKFKESRKNRETALSIKRARKRFRESGWYREHSSLSAFADGDFVLQCHKSPDPWQTCLQEGMGLDGTPLHEHEETEVSRVRMQIGIVKAQSADDSVKENLFIPGEVKGTHSISRKSERRQKSVCALPWI